MIQLKILSGKMAGTEKVVRHFPFRVGRSPSCELSLDDPGIWDKHFQITLDSSKGFELTAESNTSVVIEGNSVQHIALQNGDTMEVGLVKILFGLSSTRQRSQASREWLTWIALAALFFGQGALIYRLLNQ